MFKDFTTKNERLNRTNFTNSKGNLNRKYTIIAFIVFIILFILSGYQF